MLYKDRELFEYTLIDSIISIFEEWIIEKRAPFGEKPCRDECAGTTKKN